MFTSPVRAESSRKKSIKGDVFNVAVVGCGYRGKQLIEHLRLRKDCLVTHLCDPDSAMLAPLMKDTSWKKTPRVEKDLRKVFDVHEVDLVFIAMPIHWHTLAATWAMQAGKDVYLEKPVSHTFDEGKLLIDAVDKWKKICQVGTQLQSLPTIEEGIKFLKDGKLGQVSIIRCLNFKKTIVENSLFKPQVPSTIDYNLWLGPAREQPPRRKHFHWNWHYFWEYGGGNICNYGVHFLDLAKSGAGLIGVGDEVFSIGGNWKAPENYECPSTQMAFHRFGKKTLIQELRSLASDAPYPIQRGVIFQNDTGEKLVIDISGQTTLLDKKDKEIQVFKGNGTRVVDGSGTHIENFLSAVKNRNKATLRSNITQGHEVSAGAHLANISYRVGSEEADLQIRKALGFLPHPEIAEKAFLEMRAHLERVKITEKFVMGSKLSLTKEGFTTSEKENLKAQILRKSIYRSPFEIPKF